MKKFKLFKPRSGFTLMELLLYSLIFGATATFLVGIITVVSRSQLRQTSLNEVNAQVSFAASAIKKLIRDSSMIENKTGITTSTLILRMSSSSLDKTFVYVSSSILYVEQGSSAVGSAAAQPLTTDKVRVSNFSITKYENPGGLAVVQVDFTVDYNTSNSAAVATKSWRGAVSRVTAASFDYDLVPNANNAYNLGNPLNNWRNAFFAGSIGIGTAPVDAVKIKSAGSIGFSTSTAGVILMAPNSTCFRIGVNNNGVITTTSVACP